MKPLLKRDVEAQWLVWVRQILVGFGCLAQLCLEYSGAPRNKMKRRRGRTLVKHLLKRDLLKLAGQVWCVKRRFVAFAVQRSGASREHEKTWGYTDLEASKLTSPLHTAPSFRKLLKTMTQKEER